MVVGTWHIPPLFFAAVRFGVVFAVTFPWLLPMPRPTLAHPAGRRADGRRQFRLAVHRPADRLAVDGGGGHSGGGADHDVAVGADPARANPLAARRRDRLDAGRRAAGHVAARICDVVGAAVRARRGRRGIARRDPDEADGGRRAAPLPGLGRDYRLRAAGIGLRCVRAGAVVGVGRDRLAFRRCDPVFGARRVGVRAQRLLLADRALRGQSARRRSR